MRKSVRIALVSLATLAVSVAACRRRRQLARRSQDASARTLPPLQVTFAATDGQLDHGEYLFNTRGCMECHGCRWRRSCRDRRQGEWILRARTEHHERRREPGARLHGCRLGARSASWSEAFRRAAADHAERRLRANDRCRRRRDRCLRAQPASGGWRRRRIQSVAAAVQSAVCVRRGQRRCGKNRPRGRRTRRSPGRSGRAREVHRTSLHRLPRSALLRRQNSRHAAVMARCFESDCGVRQRHVALHIRGAVQDDVPHGQATGRLSRQRSHAVQESRAT